MATYYDLNGQPYTPPAPTGPVVGKGMPAPTPRGDNGPMGYLEAPVAGALGTAANVVQAGQAGAKALGFNSAADTAAGWANYLRQAGAGFQSPELEQNAADHPWSPSNIGYQVLKGAPGALAALGGAVVAPEAVGQAIGAGIASFPMMVGGNVEASEDANGPLTRGQAAKAIALGVPEAALGAWSGGRAAQTLAGGIVAKSAARAAASQALVGGVVGAGQDIIAQQMNDRSIPFRMNEMITSALTGGATGALLGGGLHALAKVDPNEIDNAALLKSTESVEPQKLLPPPAIKAGPPLDTVPPADLIARARAGDTAAMQEMTRRAGPSAPGPGPEPAEGVIPQPDLGHVGLGNETPFEQVPNLSDVTSPPIAEDFTPSVAEPRVEHQAAEIPQPDVRQVGLGNESVEQVRGLDEAATPPTAGDFETQGPEPHPFADLQGDDLAAAVKKATGTLPKWLKTDDLAAAQQSVRENIAENKTPVLRVVQEKIGKALGVVDGRGNVIPEDGTPTKPVDGTPSEEAKAALPPVAAKAQASLDSLKAMTDVSPPGATLRQADAVNKMWQVGLAKPRGATALWEGYGDKFSPDAQKALLAHLNDAQDAEEAGQSLFAPSTVPDRPLTQQMIDLEHIANNGGTLQHGLAYLATNGETGAIKTIARHLMGRALDAPLRMVDVAANDDGSPAPEAAASYSIPTNEISLVREYADGQDLIHEAVHAGSAKALRANGPGAQDMIKLYEAVKERSPDKDAYGLKNVDEFMAESHTNPVFQDDLRSMPADPSLLGKPSTMWGAFKNAVAKLLGMETGGKRTMLDQVLETGQRVLDENRSAPGAQDSPLYSPIDRLKQVFSTPDEAKSAIAERVSATGTAGYKAVLGIRPVDDIVRGVAQQVPSAVRWFHAVEAESNQKNAWNKSRAVAHNAYTALPEAEQAKHDASAAATYFGVDPRKPWAQQDPELAKAKNAADLKRVSDDAYRTYRSMTPAGKAAFEMRVNTNQASRAASFAMMLDRTMKSLRPELTAGFENDPARDYQLSEAGMKAHDNPALSKQFWTDEIDKRMATVRAALDAEKTAAPDGDKAEMLQRWADGADSLKQSFEGVPYFRAGHGDGDYFASGKIALDKDGLPAQPAIDAIQARLNADGFTNSIIDRANSNNKIYIKTDTPAKAQTLEKALRDLQQQGHLSKDPVSAGKAEQAVQHGVGPAVMQDIVSMLRANRPEPPEEMDPAAKQEFLAAWDRSVSDMTRDLIDMLPGSSPRAVNATRNDVQGAAKDVGRSARETDANVSAMLARQGTAIEKGASIAAMRAEMRTVNKSPMQMADKENTQNAVTELMLREARRPTTPPNGLVNTMTWVTRASEIGFNPAYALTIHSQDWTYSWPELGKTHGMVAAAKEIAKAEIPSFNIMNAMRHDPDWAHAGMRRDGLINNGISEKDANYLTALDNMGKMTHGALTQSMFEENGEGFRAKAANMSTAMGRYLEVQGKIKMALAARALWRGDAKDGPLLDFAAKKIDGAQFNYSAENRPRQLTTSGIFGPLSPLVNQFMSYRTLATTKLIREFHTMFAGDTPQEKAEAGKFLAAHLAATTVLAGAMGMPMVAVFASVYDKLADELTGSPTHDIMGSFRHYLTVTYGKTAGIAMARGLPAAAGVDMSRLGDEKIAPGSDLLMAWSEKRKWEDAEKDWLKDLAGSSVGLGMNWLLGARDIANGDYINGAVKMVPEAFKGPTEALRDALYGYRDKGGTPLGVTPGGIDLALEAMGLDPTKVATMSLNKGVLTGLEARRQIQSQNITQHLAKAYQLGDQASYQHWLGQSAAYQQEWPGMRPPAADVSRYISSHIRGVEIGQSLGGPPGLRQNNFTERQFFSGMPPP